MVLWNKKQMHQRAALFLLQVAMKIIHIIFLVVFLPSSAVAGSLRFVYSNFPPFEYKEDNAAEGINVEIIKEACRRLGVSPVFEQLPWKRALSCARTGDADAVFSLFKNKDRIRHYDYPKENINTVKMVLIANMESDIRITSLEDLRRKTVGVYHGSSYGEHFDQAGWIRKEPAHSNRSLLRKQSLGRTDVTVMDERVARYWSRKIGRGNRFKTLDYTVTFNPTYVAFSKAKREQTGVHWAKKFSVVLKEMKTEGLFADDK